MIYDANNINNGPIKWNSMVHKRENHACTIFNSPIHEGRPVVIVAGSRWGSSIYKTSEIWDFTKDGTTWEESKFDLPFNVALP